MGLLLAGGTGTAAWFFNGETAKNWLKRVTTFRYGGSGELKASMFVPSAALERPCPVLLLLDNARRGDLLCARYARHCEEHGWIAASTEAFGRVPSQDDSASAALFIEAIRANASTDGTRPVIAGYDSAGEAACRLAILEPNIFAGAILESTTSASWRELGGIARPDTAFYLFTRSGDPGRDLMFTMKDEMQRKGLKVTYDEMDGKHEPMERDEMDGAFAWLDTLPR
jgi:predicted esterase